ncbi:MAG: isocitrate lyase/phosphoenolpyruvate mutase family protein [Mycobacteriales bacterium]
MTPSLERHQRRYAEFGRLHAAPALVLPNAWDVVSARIVEDAGAAAIATTSAGVAWALGAADGNRVDRDLALGAVARIVVAVDVPVTADIETGFGETDAELAETIRGVLDAGAVGINIEDSGFAPLRPMEQQAARLRVVRAAAEASGRSLFINARVDTYLMSAGDVGDRLAETLRRSAAYLEAGADGIFVPGVTDLALLRQLLAAIPAPLNVLTGPGAPIVAELAEIGVRRISVGSALAQAAYGLVRRAASELLTDGTYRALERDLDYAELNRLVTARPEA